MNKKILFFKIIILSIYLQGAVLAVYADIFSPEKMRSEIIEFMKENDMEVKLTAPVAITQDKSGVLRITDPGNYFFQYMIQTPESKDATDPDISMQLKMNIPDTCNKAVIVTHGWIDKGVDGWPEDTASAIHNATDPNEWMSIYFDWKKGAAVINSADAARYARYIAGPRLAKAFLKLLPKNHKLEHIHLIAHSAGTWAITTAAREIADKTSAQVHLTMLDAYVPKKWDEKQLGKVDSTEKIYAEHYYTKDITLGVTQMDLPNAHNIDLTDIDLLIKTHEFPYRWYYATIAGKYRKKDLINRSHINVRYKDIEYGFARGMEVSKENFKESLSLKKGNKAKVIEKAKKKQEKLDIFNWFKK